MFYNIEINIIQKAARTSWATQNDLAGNQSPNILPAQHLNN